MKTAIPYVPDEFVIETDTPLSPNTKLTLSLYAMYNPVPILAVTLEYLSETAGLAISDEVYDGVMDNLTSFVASPIWETIVEASFHQRGDRFTNTEKVYAAHRAFISKLVHNLRVNGHDIPVQSWESKPESSETKEES